MTETQWIDAFGDNLASMLDEARLTQKDLAEMTGLSEGAISSYIRKKKVPGFKAIINIAYALDCEVSELIDFGSTID